MNNDSMNSRFKSYNYKLFVASLGALAPLGANAKTAQTSESDTASADKEMVPVSYTHLMILLMRRSFLPCVAAPAEVLSQLIGNKSAALRKSAAALSAHS